MVSTRKKARLSYAEIGSDDEGDARGPSGAGDAGQRNGVPSVDNLAGTPSSVAQVHKPLILPELKQTEPAAQDCSKALTLPLDLLCLILGFLPPETLWAVSISCKRFNSFLTSKQSKSVWNSSFFNHKVYFSGDILHEARYGVIGCGGAFRFHAVQALEDADPSDAIPDSEDDSEGNVTGDNLPWDSARASVAGLNEEDAKIFETSRLLPLSVPPCPSGRTDFAYARFLFVPICDFCGESRPPTYSDSFLWEAQRRMCQQCSATNASQLGTLLQAKQASCRTSEQGLELAEYITFLMQESYCSLSLYSGIPDLHRRRIIHEGGRHKLDESYRAFLTAKEDLSQKACKDWLKSSISMEKKRRMIGRELHEYLCLRKAYDRGLVRLEASRRAEITAAFRTKLFESLENSFAICRSDLVILNTLPRFNERVTALQHVCTDSTTYKELHGDLRSLIDDYKRWSEDNRYHADMVISSCIEDCYHDAISINPQLETIPILSEADVWIAVQSTVRKTMADDVLRYGLDEAIASWKSCHRHIIEPKTRLRTVLIREDLYNKLPLANHDVKAAALPKEFGDVPQDEDTEAGQELSDMLEHLNKPWSLFECTHCSRLWSWQGVFSHDHVSYDLGHRSYYAFSHSLIPTYCKPIGYQSDRVTAPEELPVLASKLASALDRFKAQDLARYEGLQIPTNHRIAGFRGKAAVMFECNLTRRWGRGKRSYRQMLENLYCYIKTNNVDPASIAVDHIRVHWG